MNTYDKVCGILTKLYEIHENLKIEMTIHEIIILEREIEILEDCADKLKTISVI